jgi:hypothetical protein
MPMLVHTLLQIARNANVKRPVPAHQHVNIEHFFHARLHPDARLTDPNQSGSIASL